MTVQITNNATTEIGNPIDRVAIFDWITCELIALVFPDSNGDWFVNISAGTYGITYIADSHAPQTHGPYIIEEPAP